MNLLFTVHFVIVLLFVFNFCVCRCCHRLLPFTVVLLRFRVDDHTWVLDRRWHNASNTTYFRCRGGFIYELEE
ncbi:hypothetical protein HanPSC8_Chr14g0631421 [Helianthus annuus]|nr:hypothetical protein HanPSC8_Chr14g0631421 [Helianthus annuus]